jgi:hypothetical protein
VTSSVEREHKHEDRAERIRDEVWDDGDHRQGKLVAEYRKEVAQISTRPALKELTSTWR